MKINAFSKISLSSVVRGVANAVQCEKSKVMHIGHDNKRYPYHMNSQVLEVVKEEKDLEVVFTDSIKVSGQCMAAYKMASWGLGTIAKTITYNLE